MPYENFTCRQAFIGHYKYLASYYIRYIMDDNKKRTNYNGKDNRSHKNGGKSHNKGYNPKKRIEKKDEYIPPYPQEVLDVKINTLKLSDSLLKVLSDGGIESVDQLVRKTAREMYRIKFFNKKHFIELSKALKRLGVDFKPDVQNQNESAKNVSSTQKPEIKNVKTEAEKRSEQEKNKGKKERSNKPLDKEEQIKAPVEEETSKNQKGKKNEVEVSEPQAQKGKKQDNSFDIYRIFPRDPFKPTPPIEPKKDYYIKFQRGGKWGFKNKQGKEIIPPIYDEVFSFKEDIACVERKQMFGFINRANELIIPYKYECASSFSEGLACVCLNDKCGYINAKDEVVIPFIYDAGTPFTDGTARVKQNGRWGTYYLETNEVDWAN